MKGLLRRLAFWRAARLARARARRRDRHRARAWARAEAARRAELAELRERYINAATHREARRLLERIWILELGGSA